MVSKRFEIRQNFHNLLNLHCLMLEKALMTYLNSVFLFYSSVLTYLSSKCFIDVIDDEVAFQSLMLEERGPPKPSSIFVYHSSIKPLKQVLLN